MSAQSPISPQGDTHTRKTFRKGFKVKRFDIQLAFGKNSCNVMQHPAVVDGNEFNGKCFQFSKLLLGYHIFNASPRRDHGKRKFILIKTAVQHKRMVGGQM